MVLQSPSLCWMLCTTGSANTAGQAPVPVFTLLQGSLECSGSSVQGDSRGQMIKGIPGSPGSPSLAGVGTKLCREV